MQFVWLLLLTGTADKAFSPVIVVVVVVVCGGGGGGPVDAAAKGDTIDKLSLSAIFATSSLIISNCLAVLISKSSARTISVTPMSKSSTITC